MRRHGPKLPRILILLAGLTGPGCFDSDQVSSENDTTDDPGTDPAEPGWDPAVTYVNGACLLDADCGAAHSCVLGLCAPGCEDDSQCEADRVCNPHGACVEAGGSVPSPPLRLDGSAELSATATAVHPESGDATVFLVNHSEATLTYRLAGEHEALLFDGGPAIVEPNGQVELSVGVDSDLVAASEQRLSVQVITDLGTLDWELKLQPDPGGYYTGRLTFSESYPLGHSSVAMNLQFVPGGEIAGQTFAEDSLMWPRDLAVSGTHSSDGSVSIRLVDVVPAEREGDGSVENPLAREVGRTVVMNGHFDELGTSIEGELTEHLTGATDGTVVVRGGFRLHLVGSARPSSGDVTDFAMNVPVQLPAWEFAPGTDDGSCDGLGVDFGTLELTGDPIKADACSDCVGLGASCDYVAAATCSEALLEHGYALEDKIKVGDIEVDATTAGKVPDAWAECLGDATTTNYPCLDGGAIECSGALARYALTLSPTSSTAHRRVLDQMDKEITVGSLLGSGRMVDAGLARLENVSGSVADAELYELSRAQDLFRRPLTIANAPGFFHVLAGMGEEFVRVERGGRDLTNALTLATQSVDALRVQLRLRQRTEAGHLAGLRDEVRHAAAWAHVHGAVVAHLLETYEVGDVLGRLSVFGEAIAAMANVHAELAPGNNPLGYAPEYVPMRLSAEHAGSGVTNFDKVLEGAQLAVGRLEDQEQRAIAAVQEFEQAQYQADQHYSAIEEQFNAQLITLCGIDPTNPAEPDLETCGQSGGEIQQLTQRAALAHLRVQEAQAALAANHSLIEIEEDRFRAVLLNAQELDADIGELQGEIFTIMGEHGRARAIARTDAALAECGRIDAMRGLEIAEGLTALADDLAGAGVQGVLAGKPATTIAKHAAAMAAAGVRADQGCQRAKDEADLGNDLDYHNQLEQQELTAVNQEIDRKVRESQLNEKRINSEAEVRRIAVSQVQLSLGIDQARGEMDMAAAGVLNAYQLAGSLVARRERAKRRLQSDPSNPYLNPAFLVLRNELGQGLSAMREEALRQTYLAGRALELEMNRDFQSIETRLYPARSSTEIGAFEYCLTSTFTSYRDTFGIPQQHVTELSLRRDVFGIDGPITDPVTGLPVDEKQQFQAILADPNNLVPDGSIELRFALSLVGDTKFGAYHCDDRVEVMQVKVLGDYLGDNHLEVIIANEGTSSMRRCDAEDLPASEAINAYELDPRRVVVQAGVNDFGLSTPNGGLAGWPVGGDQWVVSIPPATLAPVNADLDPTEIADVVIRFTHKAGTVSVHGATDFNPVCG